MQLSDNDMRALQAAKNLLENPGLAARLTNFIGAPIELGLKQLPANWSGMIGSVTQRALVKASEAAIFTMKDIPGEASANIWHKLAVAVSGGVGGFFGLGAMAAELPVSTTIMLRSIADVARSEGESISDVETKMACLEVFAFGGKSVSDDGTESGYFAVRTMLGKSVGDAVQFISEKGFAEKGAPVLVRFFSKLAERFGVQVTQKAAAQAIPAIGAAGGAVVNTIFMDHFQDMARGHFIVRRLERDYGKQTVRAVYDSLPRKG